MKRQDFIDRFYFDNHRIFDNDIGSIGSLETNTLINICNSTCLSNRRPARDNSASTIPPSPS
jgi:hypothetical protein